MAREAVRAAVTTLTEWVALAGQLETRFLQVMAAMAAMADFRMALQVLQLVPMARAHSVDPVVRQALEAIRVTLGSLDWTVAMVSTVQQRSPLQRLAVLIPLMVIGNRLVQCLGRLDPLAVVVVVAAAAAGREAVVFYVWMVAATVVVVVEQVDGGDLLA